MARGLSSAGCHQVTCGRSPCGWTFVRPICCRILCLGPYDSAQLWWANEVALSLCVPRPSAQYLSETITLFTDLEGSVAPYSPVAGTQAGHRGPVGGSSGLALSPGPRALPVLWALQSPGARRGGTAAAAAVFHHRREVPTIPGLLAPGVCEVSPHSAHLPWAYRVRAASCL